ncbi:MAG: hypothetical protein ACFE0S_00360 [Rhodospirillales bacterium]
MQDWQREQRNLFELYPALFADRYLPPTESLMCFGLECGPGWRDLIEAVCLTLTNDRDVESDGSRFTQVKEKYGRLEMYMVGAEDFPLAVVEVASLLSEQTCEECGAPGVLQELGGWMSTRCSAHPARHWSSRSPKPSVVFTEEDSRLRAGLKPEIADEVVERFSMMLPGPYRAGVGALIADVGSYNLNILSQAETYEKWNREGPTEEDIALAHRLGRNYIDGPLPPLKDPVYIAGFEEGPQPMPTFEFAGEKLPDEISGGVELVRNYLKVVATSRIAGAG